MAGGAGIDRRLTRDAGLAEVSVDRDMRRHRSFSQVVHELRDVIGLVRAEHDPPTSAMATINQRQRRLSFGGHGGLADDAADRQTMAVLHQSMPYVAELGRPPIALLVQPSLRVSRALVRLVGTLLLVEAALSVASRTLTVVVASILSAEALDRSPR